MQHTGLVWTIAVGVLLFSSTAWAETEDPAPELHHQSEVQVRAAPIGLSLFSDTAWRTPIWTDREGDLFEGTRVDIGGNLAASPAYLWAGPYLEVLPVAALQLRVSVQARGYWGTFGHLYVPTDDPEGEPGVWDDEALDRAWDDGLGQAATGWSAEARATPQFMVDGWAAMVETTYRRISTNVDAPYYEPYIDLLMAPTEHLWVLRPTAGYLFDLDSEHSHLLVGLRWERAIATRAATSRNVVGAVWDWGVPPEILDWGDPRISGFAGAHFNHPTRRTIYPYLGLSATVQF